MLKNRRFLALSLVSGLSLFGAASGCQGPVGGGTEKLDAAKPVDALITIRPDGSPIIPGFGDGGFKLDSTGSRLDTAICTACATDAPDMPICGDGRLDINEACDDGNSTPADGCSGVCTIEPGYVCPTPGALCIKVVTKTCGNGIIEADEACDDANVREADGCSSVCTVEVGWLCDVPGQPCKPAITPAVCGNGKVEAGEQCDDGAALDSDGCSATCQIEDPLHWTCPLPGQPCEPLQYCGDGIVQKTRGEQCDDSNMSPGDGCTGLCTVEAGYSCPETGGKCTKVWVCGNGIVDPGEACDDLNQTGSDGCSADCSTVEPRYTCPKSATNVGGPCVKAPENVCGNGVLGPGEECDDGGKAPNDGCSATCQTEPGYTCPTPGKVCTLIEFCGDGKLSLALKEQCDDGKNEGGKGCSPTCTIEPGWVCPLPGQPCVSTARCGDGKITGTEQCDDGNMLSSDGCSATCQIEAGWTCPVVNAACIAKSCGDGIVAGDERCDDANTNGNNDGCNLTCQLDPGWGCGPDQWRPTIASTTCYPTTCGDGQKEGLEECDDGNNRPFDGCRPDCTYEPKCGYPNKDPNQPYQCFSVCGDGIKMPDEKCDDGNGRNGDGCSSTCEIEPGYVCEAKAPALNDNITIPILYRDFTWHHPQFEVNPINGIRQKGIVKAAIGVDGKPVYNPDYVGYDGTTSRGAGWLMNGPSPDPNAPTIVDAYGDTTYNKPANRAPFSLTTAQQIGDAFSEWYTDDPNATKDPIADAAKGSLVKRITIQDTLTLTKDTTTGAYYYYNSQFYPIDGKGFGNITYNGSNPVKTHNYHFTSESHYWFQYNGGEKLEFRGDDDVWVFVNGRLSMDLGGIHGELRGVLTLNGAESKYCVEDQSCSGTACDSPPTTCTTVTDGFGLVVGRIYEIIVFQAERHVEASNYRLSINGFNAPRSVCHGTCGDGVVTRGEACDLGTDAQGVSKNTGAYGTCNPNCTLPDRCGDGAVQTANEDCDDGVNLATYGGTQKKCAANCKWAPYCGDGVPSNGEACDEGAANGSGYGHCTAACALGPRCGDGITNGTEQCDDGVKNGTTGSDCTSTCTLKCGNGVPDPGEQCDDGAAKNVGGYGKCKPNCTKGPYCGDGFQNGTEQCDDGKNDGTYGTCAPGCVIGPFCGDTKVNGAEICDQGPANSATAYGVGTCTNLCAPAPYCGDKQVQGQFGEVCDDGVNSGLPGSCTVNCDGFVPLPSCGDGVPLAPEQCDLGAENGLPASKCDAHCRLRCGNGVTDPGEQCDDGVNSGAYGTCRPDCTQADYCGDGKKNGAEQCDNGTANIPLSNAYGPNICTTGCTWAPYCGDLRVQSKFGEQCDGGDFCDEKCISTYIP
jgi:fibro-slime domain-containing protein